MGGLLIVGVVLGIFFFLRQPDAATFAPLAALAGVGRSWERSTTTSTPRPGRGSAPARSSSG